MNIFAVDENPKEAARMLCDKHVSKMVVESVQILSMAMQHRGLWSPGMYKPVKSWMQHPCTLWAAESWANFAWLGTHAQELCTEYTNRYHRQHASRDILTFILLTLKSKIVLTREDLLPHWKEHTPFVQTMPDKYRHPDGVQAYRNFYICEKVRFARWAHSCRPVWMDSAPVLVSSGVESPNEPQRERTVPGSVRGLSSEQGSVGQEQLHTGRRGRVDGGGEQRAAAEATGPGREHNRRPVGRQSRTRKLQQQGSASQ